MITHDNNTAQTTLRLNEYMALYIKTTLVINCSVIVLPRQLAIIAHLPILCSETAKSTEMDRIIIQRFADEVSRAPVKWDIFPVVKVVLWSRGAHLTKPGWSIPHTHSNPTNLALFRHKITLYRFNQGGGEAHTIAGGSNGSRGLSPPSSPSL